MGEVIGPRYACVGSQAMLSPRSRKIARAVCDTVIESPWDVWYMGPVVDMFVMIAVIFPSAMFYWIWNPEIQLWR